MTPLVLRPPAKINFVLRVGPVRSDGFHELHTIFQSIALTDTMTFTRTRRTFQLNIRGGEVPADRRNLVWRAAERLWSAGGRKGEPHGAAIDLQKRIPVAAGLGGASADAAAALVGLNRLWNLRLPTSELLELGTDLGSDVGFFFVGGAALGLGRGEQLYPLADTQTLGLIVVKPEFGVATADAYRWLDNDGDVSAPPATPAHSVDVGWATAPLMLQNDLQWPVARRCPEIAHICEILERAGAAPLMSGSGSAVFGVCALTRATAIARRVTRAGWRVFVTRTLSRRQACRLVGLC
jgi:4-diphosphocytidyl-2-C-methyl-D-erythritol kinase